MDEAADRELRELAEQLQQSQKMETVGRLAGGIAHDFRNLLTVILGYSQFLLTRLEPSSTWSREIREIESAAQRATTLTNQLLTFSRKQLLQSKLLDLNAVVERMEGMLRRVITEDIEIITILEPGLAQVEADQTCIEQAILNLVLNARDAMPTGGKLTIKTLGLEVESVAAGKSRGLAAGSYVSLTITDTGCGMNSDTLSHLFEPFFTTKEAGKGTGLGLASAYGTVKMSNGQISVASEPNRGTTFNLYLPALAHRGQIPTPSVALNPSEGGWETVLVVDDEEMVRRLIRAVLDKSGYSVLEASSGAEAARVSRQHNGPIDLLLTDVVMPHMSGREAAERLLPGRPEMKVLYMSGHSRDTIANHGVFECDTALLEKPFTLESLTRKIRESLAS
jgi:nitrogen-specific signal transduction histidine kinase/CheY-like chemotaxis protein